VKKTEKRQNAPDESKRKLKCPECKSTDFVNDGQHMRCRKCGHVINWIRDKLV